MRVIVLRVHQDGMQRTIKISECESWAEALISLTGWDRDLYACWSVTLGSMGQTPILVLFHRASLHPHYPHLTA